MDWTGFGEFFLGEVMGCLMHSGVILLYPSDCQLSNFFNISLGAGKLLDSVEGDLDGS